MDCDRIEGNQHNGFQTKISPSSEKLLRNFVFLNLLIFFLNFHNLYASKSLKAIYSFVLLFGNIAKSWLMGSCKDVT